jgi:hypothetical protein
MFQRCAFHSKLKKPTRFPNPAMEHMERKLEDIPNDLPKYIKQSMMMPIKNPEKYQDQV